MKTFETEKHNIPEGATHYFDETSEEHFAWWNDSKQMLLDPENANEWVAPNAYDDVSNPIEIPQTNIETPEEKEALDIIDTTPHQYESVASKAVEWNSGDKCIYMGDEFLFVGMIPTLDDFSCVIFSDTHGAKRATTIELSKPETEAERVERERLEAAEDLYITYMSKWEFAQDWRALDEINKSAFLAIVDKTNYRKESE